MKSYEDINEIQYLAITYYLAYKDLMLTNKDFCHYYNENLSVYMIPAIFIASLSCEIAIKGLYFDEQHKKLKGHDLEKLFLKLNEKTQKNIEQKTVQLLNALYGFLNKKCIYTTKNFYDDLRCCKDTFTQERYLYEDGHHFLDFNFIEAFMFSLNEISEDEYVDFLNLKR